MNRKLFLVLLIALGAIATRTAGAQEMERALSVEREVERLAVARVFWPGWEPLSIPLAVFTGEKTFLFRHPSPPAGFSRPGWQAALEADDKQILDQMLESAVAGESQKERRRARSGRTRWRRSSGSRGCGGGGQDARGAPQGLRRPVRLARGD